MDDVTIRPTGTLRIAGWLLVAAGAVLVVIVWPLFTFGGALDRSSSAGLLQVVGAIAPWVGVAAVVAGVVLVAMAARRAAANREAVQRATLHGAAH